MSGTFPFPWELNRVVFGIILALVVYAMPQAILGFIQHRARRRAPGGYGASAPASQGSAPKGADL